MKVKTLRKHGNSYGNQYFKQKDEVYEHPSPGADLKAKVVENDEGKSRRVSRSRKSPVSTKNVDGKKRDKTGDEKKLGASGGVDEGLST